ncbi:MAG: gas vesicle protein GvpG [Tepidisphaeraceae bacterium]|jgi:gas vesicle protein GvpG
MFLVDDILLSPFKGLVWIFRELHRAVDQEYTHERDRLGDQLSKAYMMLETGQLAETDFASLERQILDRLDALNGAGETDASAGGTDAVVPKDH